ncbi:MAG: RNA polymerase sigma factor, partial [Bacillota bacterium]
MTKPLNGIEMQGIERTPEMLLEDHRPFLFNFLCQLTSDRELAADLAQEVLLRAWQRFGTFRGEASLRTWLARIALNVYRTARRGQQRRPHVPQVLETLRVPDSSTDPARIVCQREF